MPPTVVIDAGHGGSQAAGGSSPNRATGPNGLLEKDLTLDLARRMRRLLASDHHIVLTRDEDRNLSLSSRAHIARESRAALFLSLHFDGAPDPQRDGTRAWIARNAPDAVRRLAASIADGIAKVTGAPAGATVERNLGVLLPERHAAGTHACLIEIAYLT